MTAELEKFIEETNEALDQFESKHGMVPLNPMEGPVCLKLPLEDLRRKSPQELSEYIYQINQYSMYIQRVINKNKCWERWVKSRLDEIAAGYLPDIAGNFGFNERILMARHNPSICKELNEFLRKLTMRLDRLYGIPEQLRIMAESIKDIKFSNMRKEKEHNAND